MATLRASKRSRTSLKTGFALDASECILKSDSSTHCAYSSRADKAGQSLYGFRAIRIIAAFYLFLAYF